VRLTFDHERKEDAQVLRWANENLLDLKTSEIGEHYGRYRLHVPEAERAMAKSIERYGQLSPVVVCRRQDRYELIDGFKRLGAAQRLIHLDHLSARLMEADERAVKAAIYGLNRAGGNARGSVESNDSRVIHSTTPFSA
jgi:ParB-like nuclease domain